VDTAFKCASFNDDAYITFAQEHVFHLGTNWQTRARLMEYLHPYQTGNRPVPSPEDQLASAWSANDAALFVKQTVLDRHGVRHWVKGAHSCRLTVGNDETGNAIRRYAESLPLECVDVLYADEMDDMTAMGLAFVEVATREDWERIGRAAGLTRKQSRFLARRIRDAVGKRDDEASWKAINEKLPEIKEAIMADHRWRIWADRFSRADWLFGLNAKNISLSN
jgi:hypothetical protein